MLSKIRKLLLIALLVHPLTGICQQTPSDAPWIEGDKSNTSKSSDDIISKNLFNANANVNIPFYTYTNGGINLSVGMAYNTSGIMVDRIASNIGLGWELYTGGHIQRETRGFEDDLNFNNYCFRYPALHGYWLDNSNDTAPDIFHAVFGQRNVRFMFSKTGQLLTIPESNIKIERMLNGNIVSGVFSSSNTLDGDELSFKITDESGNQFFYTKGIQSVVTNTSTFGVVCTQEYYPRSEWVLDKVIPYEGTDNEIKYYYTYSNITEVLHRSQSRREVFSNTWSQNTDKDIEKVFETARLTKIEYPNNINVEFQYDNNNRCDLHDDKRMVKIKVVERNAPSGITPRSYEYNFNQAYFLSPDYLTQIASNTTNEIDISSNCSSYEHERLRLKLRSITHASNGSSKLYYSFLYDPMQLPQRVYGSKDRYGYATDKTISSSNQLWVPEHSWPPSSSTLIGLDNNVASSKDYTQAASLKSIINGLSGRTDFSYASVGNIGGGLALTKVQYYDGYNHDNDFSNNYEYLDAVSMPTSNTIWYTAQQNDYSSSFENNVVWLNSCISLNKILNSSNFGYKQVIETSNDKSNNVINKNKFFYSGFDADNAVNNGSDDNRLSSGNNFGDAPFAQKQFLRIWGIGLITKQQKFDYNNELLNEVTYDYDVSETYHNSDDFKTIMRLAKKINYQNGVEETYDDEYYPFTGRTLLKKVTSKQYVDNTNYLQNITNYFYDGHKNVSYVSSLNSTGESKLVKTRYNYEFAGSTAINKMNTDGLERQLFQEYWKDGYLINSSIQGLSIIASNIIRTKYFYDLTISSPLSSSLFTGISYIDISNAAAGNSIQYFRKRSTIQQFDDKGSAIEITNLNAGGLKSYVVDNISGNVLAEAANAKYSEIAYCGFESVYKNSGIDFNKGNWNFNPNAISTQYAFLGRCSFHCSNGNGTTLWTNTNLVVGKKYVASFWVYSNGYVDINDGGSNTVSKAVVTSYNNWTLYHAEFIAQAAGIGMWGEAYIDELRLYPADALMTNSNFLPLCGKTSEVDANDIISFYEYDAFNNLSIKRDFQGNIINKIKTVTQGAD